MTDFSLRVDRLRFVREQHGFSQRELARLCNIGLNQIHRYEAGQIDPSASTLATMAHVLGVSTDYLLGLSDLPTPVTLSELSAEERQLLEAFTLGDSRRLFTLIAERLQKLPTPSQDGENSEEE